MVVLPPTYISYTDACKLGAEGVWCSGTLGMNPLLWKMEWPQDIRDMLITAENPAG